MPSRNPVSIRQKLLLWLLIPLITLCTLSGFSAFYLAETFANDSYDSLLLRAADSIAARMTRNESGIAVADLPAAAQAILRHGERDRFYFQIADSFGHRLTGDAILPLPRDLDSKGPKFRYAYLAGERVRICRVSVKIAPSSDDFWVQVAETLNSRHHFLQQIFLSIVLPQLMLVALASLSVWLGVAHGLDPLEKLSKLLRQRRKNDLSPIEIGRPPLELAPVIDALNGLLHNATYQIEAQRQFIANAAHQLRTPITALRTNAEYAERLKDSPREELYPVLQQMLEASRRVSHLVGRLLSLARSEEPKPPALVNLTEAVQEAAAIVLHEAMKQKIDLEFEMPEAAVKVSSDRGELVEILTNLLENAIAYNKENGSVWVRIEPSEAGTELVVEDTGPGIPEGDKLKVFERFYRLPESRGSGCGLGLAIVAEIAERNKIDVVIGDREGGGCSIRLKFPVVEEA